MLPEYEVARRLRERLEDALELPVEVVAEPRLAGGHGNYHPDFLASAGPYRFVVEYKASGSTDQVAMAAHKLGAASSWPAEHLPLLVVPYMSAGGQSFARQHGLSWIDLSGNARLVAPGLRVLIEGKPNQFVRRGRPRDLFAPRSARVTRALLLAPLRTHSQAELAKETALNRGTVSRVVAGLVEANLVERTTGEEGEPGSVVRVPDPNLLLEAWRDASEFSRQSIHRYSVAARSATTLMQRAAEALAGEGVDPIATGLAAAWLYAPYADFRLVTFYVRQLPSPEALQALGARPEPRGANLWLVVPKDEGVRMGPARFEGVTCVSTVQTYIDLKGHPERASDAASALREAHLRWPTPTSTATTGRATDNRHSTDD